MHLLVADTETASLEGGVCDLAVVELDNDLNVVWECESMIDPERPISPGASGIHHIVDEMVFDKPTLSEYMEMVGHPFMRRDMVISGHNIQFDCRMLGDVLPKKYSRLCTLKLARNLYPDLENHQLQTIRYMFKLEAGPAHRAMGDVITCISFLRMLARERGLDLAGLYQLAQEPLTLESKLSFGKKHRGKKLKDVPKDYIEWMLENVKDLEPDLREALALRIT